MSKDQGLINNAAIEEYAKTLSKQDSSLSQAIASYTQEHTAGAHMLSGVLVARLLQILVQLSSAKTVLDMGTFTGYSASNLAEALPEDGKVYTCDKDPEILKVAQSFFEQSEHKHKIKVIESDGQKFLQETGLMFDLIFLDAEKKNIKDYYEAALQKLKPGKIMVIDDVLWRAEVLDPKTERAQAINQLNQHLANDKRIMNVILPVRHGLQIILRLT